MSIRKLRYQVSHRQIGLLLFCVLDLSYLYIVACCGIAQKRKIVVARLFDVFDGSVDKNVDICCGICPNDIRKMRGVNFCSFNKAIAEIDVKSVVLL